MSLVSPVAAEHHKTRLESRQLLRRDPHVIEQPLVLDFRVFPMEEVD